MTDPLPAGLSPAGSAVPGRLAERLRMPIVWINLLGVVLVASALLPSRHGAVAALPFSVGVAAIAAWTTWSLLAPGRLRDVLLTAGGIAAAVAAGLGVSAMIAPLIAAAVVLIGFTRSRIAPTTIVVAAFALALALAAVAHGGQAGGTLSLLAGLGMGVLLGVTRRQRRIVELRDRELLERTVAAEREAERTRLLEQRTAVARDVHDVLAHSLGGLVLQLDAIEALLERGHVEEAAVRAAAARGLAADGLAEARTAVAALRDPAAATTTPLADSVLADLVSTHRELGASARVEGEPTLAGLDGPHREAAARALQEALSNARRHAPGATAHIRIRRSADALELRVATALGAAGTSGGGHGLTGMRERFDALGDGSTVTARPAGSEFVVDARLVTR